MTALRGTFAEAPPRSLPKISTADPHTSPSVTRQVSCLKSSGLPKAPALHVVAVA